MKTCFRVFSFLSCAVGMTSLVMAQETGYSLFTGSVGAGFSTPVYRTGTQQDDGWNAQAQAGVNFFGGRGALVGEFDFNHMGVNSTTLGNIGYPGGFTNIASFSIDPVIRFNPHGRVSFYLIGGPGVYHRALDFTAPVVVPSFFGPDAFFGTNGIVASYTTTKLGVNGGAGFIYRIGGGNLKFFGEARYTQMYTQRVMSWVPVTFGFRW